MEQKNINELKPEELQREIQHRGSIINSLTDQIRGLSLDVAHGQAVINSKDQEIQELYKRLEAAEASTETKEGKRTHNFKENGTKSGGSIEHPEIDHKS